MESTEPAALPDLFQNACSDCKRPDSVVELWVVSADYGFGAFLDLLCLTCEHRRWYRAQLEHRRRQRASERAASLN